MTQYTKDVVIDPSDSTQSSWLVAVSGATDCKPVESYPFFQPLRVIYNPYNASELFVTSFGNGLHVGTNVGGLCKSSRAASDVKFASLSDE
jgi:hypothetical protein